MNDPMERPAELDELVALLRSATPAGPALEEARRGVLSASKPFAPWLAPAGRFVFLASVVATMSSFPSFVGREVVPSPVAAPIEQPVEEIDPEPVVVTAEPAREAESAPKQSEAPRVERRSAPAAAPLVQEPPNVPPSETMAEALRDYTSERFAEAAVGFQSVADGTSEDAPDRVAQADFFLAKCLYHLELYHASAAAFDEVTRRGAEHPYFRESLRWLAMLAEHLPEPSGVIESVGRYDAEQLAALDTPATRTQHHHLSYLLGRSRYEERRFGEAVRLFRQVPDDTRWALDARFFEGVSHVRMHHARPAALAFRRVIDAVRTGGTGGHPDANRLNDLAWMSIARLYYTLAMDRDREDASQLLTHAVAAWRSIPMRSEYWLESFFEETWALYIAREHARALGHVHALDSPWFRREANPEAQVVRSMIFFEHCQWDAVEHSLSDFHARFDPIAADAATVQRMARTNEDAFRMLMAVRAGRSRVPRRVLPMVLAAFRDREIGRYAMQVGSIDRESEKLAAMGPPMLDTPVHARVVSDLAIVRSFAVERAGALARERVHRLAEDLNERMVQMDTIELELATQRRMELERPSSRPMGPTNGGPIFAVQGDQVWPFDGDWWRDELPFFMQEVQNRCSR